MKQISIFLMLLAAMAFTSCSEDDLDPESIFKDETIELNEFDVWLMNNFNIPYNIEVKYKYNDKETDQSYNVVPAKQVNCQALAMLLKHVWVESYVEIAGNDFLKLYAPRVFQFIGSYIYDGQGKVILGTAEGGLKIMLYGVNGLDLENPRVNVDNPYESHSAMPVDLNYWYFHTMHHEFCHILTQTKNYPTDFRTISSGKYHSADWINVKDIDSAKEGFVTGYASGEYNEDFAETFACYVTNSEEGWQKIIDNAGEEGADIINQKLTIVKNYFRDSWNIDINKLRDIVIRRSAEAEKMDLYTLK
ncbi:MAG: putative zinc-binding metallopeptidase [Prevotella sp.]